MNTCIRGKGEAREVEGWTHFWKGGEFVRGGGGWGGSVPNGIKDIEDKTSCGESPKQKDGKEVV